MEGTDYVLSAIFPSLVMIIFVTILFSVRRKLLIRIDNNTQQQGKIPEENDERFATGKTTFPPEFKLEYET